jgi:hypothetical protein
MDNTNNIIVENNDNNNIVDKNDKNIIVDNNDNNNILDKNDILELKEKFEINLVLNDNKTDSKTYESINLSKLSKEEIFNQYSQDKIILTDIIKEFETRRLDLWKEYKIYQSRKI